MASLDEWLVVEEQQGEVYAAPMAPALTTSAPTPYRRTAPPPPPSWYFALYRPLALRPLRARDRRNIPRPDIPNWAWAELRKGQREPSQIHASAYDGNLPEWVFTGVPKTRLPA